MNDSIEAQPPQGLSAPWVLFIHRLKPKPDYLRVKVQRRLRGLGARLLKNSVYVLPNSEEAQEDFLWLAEEVRAEGGTAMICEANFVAGMSNAEVQGLFTAEQAPPESFRARTWVTRAGVRVDRMASAWLIRRFIDPEATFRFVDQRHHRRSEGEITFDMLNADFGHRGTRCTFESLAEAFAPADRAVAAIGEIVHDLDLKDDRYRRPETAGIASLLRGITEVHQDDAARLTIAAPLFDSLYAALR